LVTGECLFIKALFNPFLNDTILELESEFNLINFNFIFHFNASYLMKVLIFLLVINNIKIHFSQTFAIFADMVYVLNPSKSINDTN